MPLILPLSLSLSLLDTRTLELTDTCWAYSSIDRLDNFTEVSVQQRRNEIYTARFSCSLIALSRYMTTIYHQQSTSSQIKVGP